MKRKKRDKVVEESDFTVDGIVAPSVSEDQVEGGDIVVDDSEQQGNMGSFIEYTISNQLNQIGSGNDWQDAKRCMVILALLKKYVTCINDAGFILPSDLEDAVDDILDMSDVSVNINMKRFDLITNGVAMSYLNRNTFLHLMNLTMKAITEATEKGIIKLQDNISVEYGAVVAAQGGGYRPQRIVKNQGLF